MVRFQAPDCDPREVALLAQRLQSSTALAQVLVRRGLSDPAMAQAFLDADETHSLDAFGGLHAAAQRVLEHARDGTRITIHGDYDVDGVCSTAILVRAMRRIGANVDWYLPDRADGYGLSLSTVKRLAERDTGLLVTADCGITSVEEVAAARALGIEVVVTDHHAPLSDGRLPDAQIVHPAIGDYPCAALCGAAVAHKLAQGVLQAAGRDARELDEDLDLVAMATIADVVSLRGENRTLARLGLRALAATAKQGVRALMTVARIDPSRVNERAVAFALGPRINAAGRLQRADAALELLLTEDPARAAQIARELDAINSERRHIEQAIRFQAQAQLDELASIAPRSAYVLAGEGWHPGVVGIVASRLAEHSRRPVVLISLDGERGRGSGRSIEGFDLLGGLRACSEHLLRYGGHSAAAGLEVESSCVPALAEALDAYAEQALLPEQLIEVERVDAIVKTSEIGMALAEELAMLAPFGRGNPVVSLMLEDATIANVRTMGEGKHARFTVSCGDAHAPAVAFGRGAQLGVAEGEPAQATFTLEVNEWNGVSEPRLVLRHAQPAPIEEATIDPCPIAGPPRSMQLLLPT